MINQPKQICEKCNVEMLILGHQRTMADDDFDEMTDGQMSDYFAAQESGDYDEWAVERYAFQCPNCKKIIYVEYS